MANSQERKNQVLVQIDQHWFIFTDRMKLIHTPLLYLVRCTIPDLVDGEELSNYGWRIFRTEILENQLIASALANRLVLIPENQMEVSSNSSSDDSDIADHTESPLFNADTIIEIMTFLSTFKLGLHLSTAARQMTKLSDYVLNKRKRILRPIVVRNGIEPFGECLYKENASDMEEKNLLKFFDGWSTNIGPESRICLPDIDPPEWLAGVELIYIMRGMSEQIFRFFYALRNQFQKCQIAVNQSEFFAKLHETGHSLQFFEFFNERCFSLVETIPTSDGSQYCIDMFAAKWPLWAIFNNIFLPNCRELTLSVDVFKMNEMEAIKWLMHPTTESRPRMLKLCSAKWYWIGNEFATMLQHIREDFFNPIGRRMFFVEFPEGFVIFPASQVGEWQNGIGEQLRIESTKITRLPMEECQNEFKDFYALPEVQPKLIFK